MSPQAIRAAATSDPIIEPPEGSERADDELVAGDAHGGGLGMRLLASGIVERVRSRQTGSGRVSALPPERHQVLDPLELTQVLARVLRQIERMNRRGQQRDQQLQDLAQRVSALEQR